MIFLYGIVVLSLYAVSGQYSESPCPGIFDYQSDGSGLIRIQPSGPVSTLVTRANFTIAAKLPTTYVGQLEPLEPERALRNYNQGSVLTYVVHFPVTSPLPKITSLVVNGREICYGPPDVRLPHQYISLISLQHMLYLNSVNNPGVLVNVVTTGNEFQQKPGDTQQVTFIDDSKENWNSDRYYTVVFNKTQSHISPEQPNDLNIFYPDQTTTTTQRPIVSILYYPQFQQPQEAFPVSPEETTKPPPKVSPPRPLIDYNQSTSPKQPRPPPNLNQSTTQKTPEQTPDYNQYNTQQPQPQDPDRTEETKPQKIPTPLPPSRFSQEREREPSSVGCGIMLGGNEKVPLIYNGQSYDRGDWPWLVAIYKRKDGSLTFICSGTLISERHVVTAAHCMQQKNAKTANRDVVVKVGVYDLEDWGDDMSVTRTLESAVIHESYNAINLANDILVITFEKTVEFSSNIRPACLWEGQTDLNRIVGASGVVAGWGKSELGPGGQGEPRMVRIPVVSTGTCRASKPDFHKLTSENTLCADFNAKPRHVFILFTILFKQLEGNYVIIWSKKNDYIPVTKSIMYLETK